MQNCLRQIMETFHSVVGFTHSDEMIIFIKPTNIVRGERQPHFRDGRVQKIATLAASLAASKFFAELVQLCVKENQDFGGLAEVLPHFDCRMGHYESWEEARGLLMWRAYDCSVNGVADAVCCTNLIKGSSKTVKNMSKVAKAEWLWKHDLLPLPKHQAYGHLLVRVFREVQGHNPKTESSVTRTRHVIEHLEGPVLELFRKNLIHDSSLH